LTHIVDEIAKKSLHGFFALQFLSMSMFLVVGELNLLLLLHLSLDVLR
jgi:hypothetical protein